MKTMKFEATRQHSGPTERREVYTDDLSKVPPLEPGFSEWKEVRVMEVPDAGMVAHIREHGYATVSYPLRCALTPSSPGPSS